jgi:hypothetical protein
MNTKRILGFSIAALALAGMAISMVGCSTDENPITPEKMQDIRKKQDADRANFHPDMTPPPAKK